MAIDSNNKLHISYYDETNSKLKYATNASGGWVLSAIDDNSGKGRTSIIVDSNNNPHISYYDNSGHLKYAYYE